jgi:hypothetical protein
VNKLAVNLPSKRVNHGYLKVLVVAEATLAPVLDKLFAVKDCLGVGGNLITGQQNFSGAETAEAVIRALGE